MLAALRDAGLRREARRPARRPSTAWAGDCPVAKADLFLGNAGTAMRPLTAALAVLGGDFELRGVPAHARASDRRSGRRPAPAGLPDRLPGQPGLSAAAHRQAHAGAGPADPGARRRVEPVPDRTADGPAAGGAKRHRDRGPGRTDFPALHRDHAQPAGALRRRRYSAKAGSVSRFPRAASCARPAICMSRPMRRRPAISSRSARSRRLPDSACGSTALARTRSRAISASWMRRGRWARRSRAAPTGSRCRAGRSGTGPTGALDRPSTCDCNHIPDAAMTLAVMALYANGTTHPAQHRQLARQGNRPHRRHDHRAAQVRRHRRGRPRLPARHAASRRRRLARRQRSTPTTTTAWRCACRWPRSIRRDCRCASTIRSASPRPIRTISKICSPWCRPPLSRHSGDLRRWADRIGQGHTGGGAGAAPGLPLPGFRRACTGSRRWRPPAPAWHSTPAARRPSRHWSKTWTSASSDGTILLGAGGRQRSGAHRGNGHERVARVGTAPGARAP